MLRTSRFALLACFHTAFVFSQEALSERLAAAEARTRAATAFFSAEGEVPLSLEQGFPNLSRAPLTDTAFLNARRQQLRELEDARARERLASGAADLELVRAACDAEDSCDADFAAAKTIAQEAAVSSRYVYLDEPVRVSLQEGPAPGMATHFALQITVKAYVFDGRFETAFGTDVTERVKRAFKAGGIHTVGERDSPPMRSEDL